MSIAYYRNFKNRNSLRFGVSAGEYRFWELKNHWNGTHGGLNQENIVRLPVYTVELGYRITMPIGRALPYFENIIAGEALTHGLHTIRDLNMSYKGRVGFLKPLNNYMTLNVNGFFKTGITRYDTAELGDTYRPYAIGMEAGIMFFL
jgi:hypothetical protein